jgi:hypothetical protein
MEDAKTIEPGWALPTWAAGAADPHERRIVVGVTAAHQRQDRERVLLHELTHVAIRSAAGEGHVPRWFDEGVSRVVAHEDGEGDGRALAQARIGGAPFMLEGLVDRFPASGSEAAFAYAISGRAVRVIEQHGGRGSIARILANVRAGGDFETALVDETGRHTWQIGVDVERTVSLWHAWATVLREIDLWMIVAGGLAVLAGLRARARQRTRLAALIEEDERARPALEVVMARWSVGQRRSRAEQWRPRFRAAV